MLTEEESELNVVQKFRIRNIFLCESTTVYVSELRGGGGGSGCGLHTYSLGGGLQSNIQQKETTGEENGELVRGERENMQSNQFRLYRTWC